MPKRKEWLRGNMRMRFNSGNKAYDNYVVSITTCSSIGGGVRGGGIRAYTETECNNHRFAPGELQQADFRWFDRLLEGRWRDRLKELCKTEGGMLYVFYHPGQRGTVVHGALFLRNGRLVERFEPWPMRSKSMMVLDEAIKYLSDDYDEDGNLIAKAG